MMRRRFLSQIALHPIAFHHHLVHPPHVLPSALCWQAWWPWGVLFRHGWIVEEERLARYLLEHFDADLACCDFTQGHDGHFVFRIHLCGVSLQQLPCTIGCTQR